MRRQICTGLFRNATRIDAFQDMLSILAKGVSMQGPETESAAPALEAKPDSESAEVPAEPAVPIRRDQPKVGRNDLCPCGSGKKYKNCCGQ